MNVFVVIAVILAAFVGGAFLGKHATELSMKKDSSCSVDGNPSRTVMSKSATIAPAVSKGDDDDDGRTTGGKKIVVGAPMVVPATKAKAKAVSGTRGAAVGAPRIATPQGRDKELAKQQFVKALGFNGKTLQRQKGQAFFNSDQVLPKFDGQVPTFDLLVDAGFSSEVATRLMLEYKRLENMRELLDERRVDHVKKFVASRVAKLRKEHQHPDPALYRPYSNDPMKESAREHAIAAQLIASGSTPSMESLRRQGLTEGAALRVMRDYKKRLASKKKGN